MIVRNETRTLPRLVASLDGVIDEWCIIDTGSDDGTPEVVLELLGHLPGRLEHRPWKDFGHNRTELVRLCRTLPGVTHLLLADADMTVSITDDFRTQLGRQSCPMLLVPVRVGGNEYRMPYLVRNDIDWYYESPTHEYLTADAGFEWAHFDDLVITHHEDGGTRIDKYERDRLLLETRIVERPDDARSVFYLARTLRDLGRADEAIAMYERRVAMGRWEQEQYICLLEIGDIHALSGRAADAAWAWQRAIGVRPSRAESYHRLGQLLNAQRMYAAARVVLDRAAQLEPSDDQLFVERSVERWGVAFEHALACWWTGDRPFADSVFAELSERPDVPEAVRVACRRNLALPPD
jgi:tetratricopeptide (TPR) repeat protein